MLSSALTSEVLRAKILRLPEDAKPFSISIWKSSAPILTPADGIYRKVHCLVLHLRNGGKTRTLALSAHFRALSCSPVLQHGACTASCHPGAAKGCTVVSLPWFMLSLIKDGLVWFGLVWSVCLPLFLFIFSLFIIACLALTLLFYLLDLLICRFVRFIDLYIC